jgi:hypothetical protein
VTRVRVRVTCSYEIVDPGGVFVDAECASTAGADLGGAYANGDTATGAKTTSGQGKERKRQNECNK